MIVNRRTFIAKRAKLKRVVELLKQAVEMLDFPGATRIYTPEFAAFDTVVFEMECEDLDQYQKFWAGSGGTVEPEWREQWWEEWFANTENGGANEIWRLAD
jgi:hypothetical protein